MVFVCNLRSIHSLANVVVLFTLKTCQPCHYIKPMSRERRANKNTQRSLGYLSYDRRQDIQQGNTSQNAAPRNSISGMSSLLLSVCLWRNS